MSEHDNQKDLQLELNHLIQDVFNSKERDLYFKLLQREQFRARKEHVQLTPENKMEIAKAARAATPIPGLDPVEMRKHFEAAGEPQKGSN